MWEKETLYHYTSAKALKEVITDRGISLWFSRFDCHNDTSESKVAINIQEVICDELKQKYINDEGKNGILEKIVGMRPDFMEFFFEYNAPDVPFIDPIEEGAKASVIMRGLSTVPYICSFSYEKDAVTMWNYYTKGNHYEGYNIGIDPYKMRAGLVDLQGNVVDDGLKVAFGVVDVIYNEEEQRRLVKKEVEHYLDKGEFSESDERTYLACLNKWAISFKNEVFKHEKEERLICYVPVGDRYSHAAKDYIRFRELNGCLIPYLNIMIDKKALKDVTIGPLIESDVAKSTVELMLELRGYDGVEVGCSKVPVRY